MITMQLDGKVATLPEREMHNEGNGEVRFTLETSLPELQLDSTISRGLPVQIVWPQGDDEVAAALLTDVKVGDGLVVRGSLGSLHVHSQHGSTPVEVVVTVVAQKVYRPVEGSVSAGNSGA